MGPNGCSRTLLAHGATSKVEACSCGTLHVTIGALTLRLDPNAASDIVETLTRAVVRHDHVNEDELRSTPPPPHDPSERELVYLAGEWEVRIFDGPRFRYFVERGLWHVQLWHPARRVSVLTPSALTQDSYEVYPIRGWKERASTARGAARLLAEEHALAFVDETVLANIERAFVTAPVELATTERVPS